MKCRHATPSAQPGLETSAIGCPTPAIPLGLRTAFLAGQMTGHDLGDVVTTVGADTKRTVTRAKRERALGEQELLPEHIPWSSQGVAT